ncbi:transcriptional regulator [Bhargavaea cecembensis]|uniref:Transcriptional regulator n=1 Tax=Bhargavaea cecembensis TaxID=394098 RepID=A0A165HHV3_9BACL|nr:transcription repressor NadR [Bhargavaea cecembensis]KZE40019.1 transcriptional regulator [Bhargavaea cecembensis]
MEKLKGDERRERILKKLKDSKRPIKGAELAKICGVSRQVIVGDITLLKAHGESIMATSSGYVHLGGEAPERPGARSRKVACTHTPDQTESELNLIVDAGASVRDVTVEHPVYGELNAAIMVNNRHDVGQFLARVQDTGSPFLLELTGGPHLHTITADSEEILDRAVQALREHGFLTDEA